MFQAGPMAGAFTPNLKKQSLPRLPALDAQDAGRSEIQLLIDFLRSWDRRDLRVTDPRNRRSSLRNYRQ